MKNTLIPVLRPQWWLIAVCAAKHLGYKVKKVTNDKTTGIVKFWIIVGKNSKTDTAASFAINPKHKAQIKAGLFKPIGANKGAKKPHIENKIESS